MVSEIRYKAWGGRYASGATFTDYKYTGQLETDIGIYFFVARFYDPLIGRFLSADSIIPGSGNPLAWDRYAYSLWNPLRYIDPSGHSPCDGPNGGDPECNGLKINRRVTPIYRTDKPITDAPGSSNSSPLQPPQTLEPQQPPHYEPRNSQNDFYDDMIVWLQYYKLSEDFQEVILFLMNHGLSGWRHVKGVIPGGFFLEAAVGGGLQFANDIKNPNLRVDQRIMRPLIVGFEDGITDSVATSIGATTAGVSMTAAGAITSETGPGALVAADIAGATGFVVGSYATTTLMDNVIWAPLNKEAFYFYFPE